MRLPPAAPRARGQALTEFIVLCLALLPLFLLMPVVAKYQDIAHTTAVASRYVAFDATVNNPGMSDFKSASQLADEVRRRFYSNTDAPIKTDDTAGDFKANRNLFWQTPQGDPLIAKFSDVAVSFGDARSAAPEDGVSGSSDAQLFQLPLELPQAMGLRSGIYRANVSVKLADLEPLDGSYSSTYRLLKNLGLTMTSHTNLVIDMWAAKDPQQVEKRINTPLMFPGSGLQPFKTLLKPLVGLMEWPACFPSLCVEKTPKIGELEFWRDEVPTDRLQ